jgi:type I restriction enzyme S subunit
VPAGTLIFVVRGMSLKKEFRVGIAGTDVAFGQDCKALMPRPGLLPEYLYYALVQSSDNVLRCVDESSHGTGRLETKALGNVRIRVPPPAEQRRVAEILDTVDDTIRSTELLIAKLEQMKQGLMHDLLTRGINSHDGLRDPLAHPEAFKLTLVGLVPRDWRVIALRDCLSESPRNGIYKPEAAIGHGHLLVGQTAITRSRSIDFRRARRAQLGAGELERFGLRAGDVLVSRVFATAEGVGQPAMVPGLTEPAVYESNMLRLRTDRSVLDPRVLFHILRTDSVRRRIVASAHSSNQTSVNQRELSALQFAVPPLAEQERLLEIVSAHDSRLESEAQALALYQALKTGLMDDLLTGRVWVKVENKHAA